MPATKGIQRPAEVLASRLRGNDGFTLTSTRIGTSVRTLTVLVSEDWMPLSTRLTDRLDIKHPVLLAPMALVAGGALAGAVTAAGGLGIIGGGYGDAPWLESQFAAAGNHPVGCGFITWSLATQPQLLDVALAHKPAAIMLSFGDPRPFAARIKGSGARLICQVQRMAHVEAALEAGAEVVVAQGAEAGGHGAVRATLPFVPAVVDRVARDAPDTVVVAAGGIADGRGLAAALMLGAEGVLVGTRFYATEESLAHPAAKARLVAGTGEDTLRTTTVDIVRGLDWPDEFTGRAIRNPFIDAYHGGEARLAAAVAEEQPRYARAVAEGDFSVACIFAGEAIGLIDGVAPAGAILARMAEEAEAALAAGARRVRR
jgi:nitronate monooxygenase